MSFKMFSFFLAAFSFCVNLQPGVAQVTEERLEIRRNDAIHLTREARALARQVKQLSRKTKKTLAMQSEQARQILAALPDGNKRFDLEVKESTRKSDGSSSRRIVSDESKPMLQNYTDLVAKYHAALEAYLQHRKEVQAHAAAFHEAAQQQNSQSNNQPMMIAVPTFAPLAVRTQDACEAMQQAEAGLHAQEEELNQAIQLMMNNRKTLSAAQYSALWSQSQQRAAALQSGASGFDQSVVAKQQAISNNMHVKMQEAMRDGDYVLSQQVYGDEQRSSMLIHEEVKRATKHSQLAMLFLNQLQSLSPYGQSSAAGSAYSGNPNQFADDDRMLAAEYEQVQSLYKQVQEASPQFHK